MQFNPMVMANADDLQKMVDSYLAVGGKVPESLLRELEAATAARTAKETSPIFGNMQGFLRSGAGKVKSGVLGLAKLIDELYQGEPMGPPKAEAFDQPGPEPNSTPVPQGFFPQRSVADLAKRLQSRDQAVEAARSLPETVKEAAFESAAGPVFDNSKIDPNVQAYIRKTLNVTPYQGNILPEENMASSTLFPAEQAGTPETSTWDTIKDFAKGFGMDQPAGQGLLAASLGILGAQGTYGNSASAIGRGGLAGVEALQQAQQRQSIDKFKSATLAQQERLAGRKEDFELALEQFKQSGKIPERVAAAMEQLNKQAENDYEGAVAGYQKNTLLHRFFGDTPPFGRKPRTPDQILGSVLETDPVALADYVRKNTQLADKSVQEEALRAHDRWTKGLGPKPTAFQEYLIETRNLGTTMGAISGDLNETATPYDQRIQKGLSAMPKPPGPEQKLPRSRALAAITEDVKARIARRELDPSRAAEEVQRAFQEMLDQGLIVPDQPGQ